MTKKWKEKPPGVYQRPDGAVVIESSAKKNAYLAFTPRGPVAQGRRLKYFGNISDAFRAIDEEKAA